eukprot:SAG11_NODE_13029_length_673_cov_1.590592_1_plen_79_part_00
MPQHAIVMQCLKATIHLAAAFLNFKNERRTFLRPLVKGMRTLGFVAAQANRYGPAHAISGSSIIDLSICDACSSPLVP